MKKKIVSFLRRLIIIFSICLGSIYIIELILQYPFEKNTITLYLYVLFASVLVSEGVMYYDRHLDKKLNWYYDFNKRLSRQLIFTIIWSALIAFSILAFCIKELQTSEADQQIFFFAVLIGFILVLFYNSLLIAQKFFASWKLSVLEIEKLKHEKAKSDYMALQDQLNPHFLFNNLNVLLSEIKYNSSNAIAFTEELATVYRYVLQSKNLNLVPVSEELDFLNSYLFLHKTRVGNGLHTEINIPEDVMSCSIPPLTLQILVENVLKHNIVTEQKPLFLKISVDENHYLIVSNNIQLRTSTYSTNTGLNNIQQRYAILSDQKVIIDQGESVFTVKVPLISN